jgi:ribosome-associated protein
VIARLLKLAGSRATKDGVVVLTAQRFRTQDANRTDALARLVELIRQAAEEPKRRRPTRPTAGAVKRRLASKAKAGTIKRLRGRPADE